MSINEELRRQMQAQTAELQSNVIQELSEINANVRWYTTLVVATIAGLAGYRQMQGAESLSFIIAVVVLFLCVSLLSFLLAVRQTRLCRKEFVSEVGKLIEYMHQLERDEDIPISEAKVELEQGYDRIRNMSGDVAALAERFEIHGLTLFIAAAIVSAPVILLSELVDTIFG